MSDISLTQITDFLGQHAPFDQMSSVHIDYLAKRLTQRFYAKDEVIIGPEDGPAENFYIIKLGRVRGESKQSDKEGMWELVKGECFPVGALLNKRSVRLTSRAIEDTFCFELKRADFEYLLKQSSVFNDFCTRRMANLLDSTLRSMQLDSASKTTDSVSLDTTVKNLIQRRPVYCGAETSIRAVLEIMRDEHIGSMVIADSEHHPIGIITLHDVLERIALPQIDLDTPIEQVMSKELLTLSPNAPAHEAALMMTRTGIGHLIVVDNHNRLTGVLSERNLFSLQRIGLVNLSRSITSAESIKALAKLENDVHWLADQMLAQGASVAQLMQLITELNDNTTRRVIELVLQDHPTDIKFTWLAFGSEGRFEQTLKTDQDNGIIFEADNKEHANRIREQLLPLAKKINNALDKVGFPLCPGNIMASNPECCLSIDEWKSRFTNWVDQGTPEHLLKASIFFDYRVLYGDDTHANDLRSWLTDKVAFNSRFRHQMAAVSLQNRPPLGLFGDIKVSNKKDHPNSINLKLHGVTPFIDGARIYAFATKVDKTNTIERFRAAAKTKSLKKDDAETWIEAYQFLQLLRMKNHHEQKEKGERLSNYFDPDKINDLERRILKEALRQARKLQSRIALDYQL